jgi:hypothetical protein
MHLSGDPGVWLAAFLTLCIFSFLYKDNLFYRIAEHLVVGVSAGYWLVILLRQTFVPYFIVPIFQEGTWNVIPGPVGILLLLVAAVLGLLIFTRYTPRHAWLARIPIAVIWGIGSGFVIPLSLQTKVIRQIQASIIDLRTLGTLDGINSLLVMIGVLSGLTYFFFSKPHRGAVGAVAKVGIWTLMIGFGATFGFTAMARISLLIGRADFLLRDWLGIIR